MGVQKSANRSSLIIGQLMQNALDFDEPSGPRTHFIAVLKALHSLGHDVSLLVLQSGRRVIGIRNTQLKPEAKELGFSGSKPFTLVEGCIRYVQSRLNLIYLGLFDSFRYREACIRHLSHCDVFHERYTLMSLGGVWAARRLSIPLILEVHADIINVEMPLHRKPLRGLQRVIAELITRQCFKLSSKIIVVSDAVGRRLQSYWRVPSEKIVVVPLGADVELFRPRTDSSGVRAEFGLDDEPIVMFTGSFQTWHGVDKLIQAFSEVVPQVPGAKLVLVGDGRTRGALEAQVREMGLADRVVFTGGVPYERVPRLLSVADVAVAPYPELSSELWFSPLKLFEYMAASKAIVASNVGQISEVLEDGTSGLLVQPGDVTDLSRALIRLLRDRELRSRLGENARKAALEKHSWRCHAERLEEIYFSVVS
jgi:glycosyltransferase involved in cell wall biosynthesis